MRGIECHERRSGILRDYRPERFVAAKKGGVSTRFGGVGAWRARSNSAVLSARLRSREAVQQRRSEAIRAGEGLT